MKFRSGSIAKLLFAVLLAFIAPSYCQSQPKDRTPQWTATIQVLVRGYSGVPISGLSAEDFTLTEHGAQDKVLEARSLFQMQSHGAVPEAETSKIPLDSTPLTMQVPSPQQQTWVLFILAPMSTSGRDYAIKGLVKVLKRAKTGDCRIAMLDDEGDFVPFSQSRDSLLSRLEKRERHVRSTQVVGGPWVGIANRVIEELAIRPGRHAIVFVSDFESDVSAPEARNPQLLRIGPSAFVGAAVRAQAAMYTIQGSGPGTVVPFGGAAESQDYGSGQQVADMLMSQNVSLGNIRSDYSYAAAETGGLAPFDVQDAFAKIAADAAGYYLVTFEPKLEEADGAWHPISIAVRAKHARIRGPRYYLAPTDENRLQIPAALKEALKRGASTSGLQIAAHVWLFPGGGAVHTGIMAADLDWAAKHDTGGSRLRIFVQLVDDSMGRVVGSWLSDRDWHSGDGHSATVHWQREASLYPGSYTLKVMAMDLEAKNIGTSAYSFLVTPMTGPALRFSEIVISERCLAQNEREGRPNLLDPMLLEGCLFAPSASSGFSRDQNPSIFVRIYPPNEKLGNIIMKEWKAYAVLESGRAVPLAIEEGGVRGLVASGKLMLSELNLGPGTHPVKVVFEVQTGEGRKPILALNSQFSVAP